MGSGKTVCGLKLADMLNIPFYDLDTQIEKGEKKTIRFIFEEEGEAKFRELEQRYLERYLGEGSFVLSLGGGAICGKGLPDKVKEAGVLVYLNPSVELLAKRLEGSKERPLLRNGNNEQLTGRSLEKYIQNLLRQRRQWYEQANITIDIGADMDQEEVGNRILSQIETHDQN